MFDFLDPPQAPDEIGRLGHYRVLTVLAETDLCYLLHAEHTLPHLLHRPMTLQVLKSGLATDSTGQQLLFRSAQTLAHIKSPYVASLCSVSEDNGRFYMAFAPLQKPTLLEQLHEQSRPPLSEVLRIGRELALGLAALHERECVHRDLYPGIIFFAPAESKTEKDAANVAPLPTSPEPPPRVQITDLNFTMRLMDPEAPNPGVPVGTVGYLPPEQARCEPATPRSDLFSLGVILYQMCAGKLPFEGSTAMEQVLALMAGNPWPLRDLRPDLPPALPRLIHQLLEGRPELRPASASKVAERLTAIERELLEPPVKVAPAQPQARRGCLGRTAALLVGLALAIAALWLDR